MINKILIAFLSLVAATTVVGQNTVMVNNSNAVITYPLNFWSANAVQGRTGFGLGSAATNPASAFQPSSVVLSNLASSNAVNLTNLRASNVVGVLSLERGGTGATNALDARTALGLGTASTNPESAFQFSSVVLSNLASSNAVNLTNLRATNIVGTIPASNIGSLTLTNISGTLAISNGGTGANDAPTARTNLGLGSTNDVQFNTVNTRGIFDGTNEIIDIENNWLNYLGFGATFEWGDTANTTYVPFAFGGTNAALNTAITRTNLGFGAGSTNEIGFGTVRMSSFGINFIEPVDQEIVIGLPSDTDPVYLNPIHWNDTNVRTSLGLGVANNVRFNSVQLSNGAQTNLSLNLGSTNRGFYATAGPERVVTVVGGINALQVFSNSVETATGIALSVSGAGSFGTNLQIGGPLSFSGTNAAGNAGATRTNLSLGWAALTNSNAGTGLVSVNTNGEVVSPTNFWQVSPANTRVQLIQPVATSTNTATNARNLYLYSLAISTTGVTNTVQLPTNGGTLLGDVATVIHEGPTSSVTAIRQIGSGTNIITLNQFQEAVQFIYESGGWRVADNISQVEPLYFSGTNAAVNAAASRTNLGLGWLALTSPQSSLYSGLATTLLGYVPEINPSSSNLTGYNVLAYTNTNSLVIPANILIGADLAGGPRNTRDVELNGTVTIKAPFSSPTTVYANNSITATDNSSYTNVVVSFISNSVEFSNATVSGTLTATSTVTAKTNLIVEGRLDFTTNATNSNPATNNHIQDFIEIRVGTNQFWLPVYK